MNNALLSSKDMSWCTPPDFFAELDREFGFTLDPAATAKSAKCAQFYTPDDDGLKQDWGGGNSVFCNPPYGRAIYDWVRKGYEESRKPGTVVVMLIPARTDVSLCRDRLAQPGHDEGRQGHGAGVDRGRGSDGQRAESQPQRRGANPHQSTDRRQGNERRQTSMQSHRAIRNRLEGSERSRE